MYYFEVFEGLFRGISYISFTCSTEKHLMQKKGIRKDLISLMELNSMLGNGMGKELMASQRRASFYFLFAFYI